MRTMLLAAAAALTLNAGVALADSGDSFDYNRALNTPASSQAVQPDLAQANAPGLVIGHSVSQTQDVRTDQTNYPISWGSG